MATLALFVALELRTAALSSLYLQNVLGSGALEAGLGFLPFAVVIGGGMHVAGHLIARAGVRVPMASGFAMAAGGLLLLSRVSAGGSYFADVLPGMLIVGAGLGMILVSVSVSVLTSAAEEESGMLSGLNTTMARLEPLLERGQRDGTFRPDVSAAWHVSMLLALVHAASAELRTGGSAATTPNAPSSPRSSARSATARLSSPATRARLVAGRHR